VERNAGAGLSLGTHRAFHGNFGAAQSLRDAFKALAGGIDRDHLLEAIAASLTFPLPEEADVEDHHWPEPLDGTHSWRPEDAALPHDVHRRISTLIDRALDSRSALFRLIILSEFGLLLPEMAERLSSKLWQKGHELPDIGSCALRNLLALPEPQPGHASRALADWFLKSPPPSLGTPIVANSHDWFGDLFMVSKPYRRPEDSRFVSWSPGEAETLLTYAESWWHAEGRKGFEEEKGFLGITPFRNRLYGVRRSLARAIAPNLATGSDAAKLRLPRLLEEIAESGYPVLSARPLLLRFKIGTMDAVADQLIEGLRSRDRDTVMDALWGAIHWYEFKDIAKLQNIPPRLLEQMLIFLAARADGESASNVVATVEAILGHDQKSLTNRAKELLALALDGLQGRAAYPDDWHQREGLRYANTVDLRRNAVLLASAAHRAGIDNESVQYWLDEGQKDPLHAVRQALQG
jgi:hypothetical protein